jgi:hypothetical protein
MNQLCEECKTEINPNDNYWHDKKGYFLCESCFIAALSQNIEEGIQDLDDLDTDEEDDSDVSIPDDIS